MDIGIAFFGLYFLSYLLWAFTGSFLTKTLRDDWPDIYITCGSPTGVDFWWKKVLPNNFDKVVLNRQFRKFEIDNNDLLIQFEIIFWTRWAQIMFLIIILIGLLMPHERF